MKKILLKKKDIICEMILIKKNKNKLSILIETDQNNNCYSYSIKINENNIKNEKGESLNILYYLEMNKNNELIKKISDTEIIIEFNIEKIYKIKNDSNELNNIKIENIKDNYIVSIKLIRNEYYVFWRDPNFETTGGFGKTLEDCKLFCYEEANMSLYYERSIENALKFIKTKINDKLILISNIGKDLSGKRFVEIAREIYGYDLIVLFYSFSKYDFIEEFPNCLYTKKREIYEKYITNFNKEGLKELKKEVEKEYNIKLNGFPNDISLENYFMKIDNSFSLSSSFNSGNFIRHVYIKNGNKYLYMSKDKKLILVDKLNKECEWDVTILEDINFENNNTSEGNTITLFSNNYYLKDYFGDIEGYKYVEIWNFKREGNYIYFISKNDKNNILSIKGKPKLKSIKKIKESELFELIDIKDDNYNILSNISFHSVSNNISNQVSSFSLDN